MPDVEWRRPLTGTTGAFRWLRVRLVRTNHPTLSLAESVSAMPRYERQVFGTIYPYSYPCSAGLQHQAIPMVGQSK